MSSGGSRNFYVKSAGEKKKGGIFVTILAVWKLLFFLAFFGSKNGFYHAFPPASLYVLDFVWISDTRANPCNLLI